MIIYTDGACRGNPGPGGLGVIILHQDKIIELGEHHSHTTNNRMEILATIKGLAHAQILAEKPKKITLFTDSTYVIKGALFWVKGWEKNNWQTASDSPVKNKDLWEELNILIKKFDTVDFQYVQGHAGVPGNERADAIACAFADQSPIVLFDGSVKDYFIPQDSLLKPSAAALPKEQRNKSSSKQVFYISLIDGNLQRHSTWDACKNRVHGVKNARYKKVASEEEVEAQLLAWQKKQ